MLLAPEKFAPEEILTILQTGIVACKVATRLCEIISNQLEPPKFTTRAKVGTFFARDNAANFLTWCKLIGVSNPKTSFILDGWLNIKGFPTPHFQYR